MRIRTDRPDPSDIRHLHGTADDAWRDTLDLVSVGVAARLVRGTKMRTKAALFDELAAALQFPPYFGENWDALAECLATMPGLMPPVGGGVLAHAAPDTMAEARWALLVADAEQVLADADPKELRVFRRCLRDAIGAEAQPHGEVRFYSAL